MDNINDNLTDEQKRGIDNQDVTQQGVVDVEVLEQSPEPLPEQPQSDTGNSNLDRFAQQAADRRSRFAQAKSDALKRAQEVEDQESIVRTLGGEKLGQGQAQIDALAESGLDTVQQEIDELDNDILSAISAIQKARIRDEQDVNALAGQGLGIPASIVRGRQALLKSQREATRRIEQVDIQNSIATSELMQGKTDKAREAIKESIRLQFEDKKAEFELEEKFLERSDKKLSDAQEAEREAVKEQMAAVEKIFDIQEIAAKNNAPASVVRKIGQASNESEALQIAGRYSVSISDRINMARRADEVKARDAINARIEAGEIVLSEDQRDTAFKLGDDWEKESKNFKDTVDGYNKFVAASNRAKENDSPAAHLAVVFNYMKTLDPTSVVRESEFSTAAGASAWMQKAGESGVDVPLPIAKAIRKMDSGELLSDGQIDDFSQTVQSFYDSAKAQQGVIDTQYLERSKQFGVPGEAVVRDLRSPLQLAETPAEEAAAVVEITNDYSNSVLDSIINTNLYGGLNIE